MSLLLILKSTEDPLLSLISSPLMLYRTDEPLPLRMSFPRIFIMTFDPFFSRMSPPLMLKRTDEPLPSRMLPPFILRITDDPLPFLIFIILLDISKYSTSKGICPNWWPNRRKAKLGALSRICSSWFLNFKFRKSPQPGPIPQPLRHLIPDLKILQMWVMTPL